VCKNVFVGAFGQVKGQCFNATKMFVGKLEMCFPNCELMNALNIMYPQFWMHLDANIVFLSTLASSKNTIVNQKM